MPKINWEARAKCRSIEHKKNMKKIVCIILEVFHISVEKYTILTQLEKDTTYIAV